MLRGDWGFSFVSRINVDTLILQRLPVTLVVLGAAQLLAILIAVPIGTYSALRPYSLFDQLATTFAFIGFSLPTFFTGLLFILLFSIYLDWLPFIYRADIGASGWRWYWEHLRQSIMPVAVLGLFQAAAMTRFIRAAVLDVIRLDYVNTARAKGLSERATLVKHVVRNALIPVVPPVGAARPRPPVPGRGGPLRRPPPGRARPRGPRSTDPARASLGPPPVRPDLADPGPMTPRAPLSGHLRSDPTSRTPIQ